MILILQYAVPECFSTTLIVRLAFLSLCLPESLRLVNVLSNVVQLKDIYIYIYSWQITNIAMERQR